MSFDIRRPGNRPRGRYAGGASSSSIPTVSVYIPKPATQSKEHLKEHLDTFFGSRNGTTFVPEEGRNFTVSSLSKMSNRVVSDRCTVSIVKNMPIYTRPFYVFDAGAGIGGNSLSFADNGNVAAVFAFEKDDETRKMLENNVKDYNFERKISINKEFSKVPSEYSGSVLFIHPDWPRFSGEQSFPTKGITFAGRPLEQLLAENRHCSLVAIRLPLGYELESVAGFYYQQYDLKKSLLLIAISKEGMQNAERKGFTNFTELTKKRKEEMDSEEWLQKFQMFLFEKILARVFPDDQQARVPYLEQGPMRLWLQAFTHESYDIKFNYEELETIGDRTLEDVFTKYLVRLHRTRPGFPELNKAQITQLKRYYMSGKQSQQQQKLTMLLGASPFLRYIGTEMTTDMFEDLFESIFGALSEITDMYVDPIGMSGTANCYRLIKSIFDEVGIDLTAATEGDKSLVYQIFNQSDWGMPIEEVVNNGELYIVKIKFSDKALVELGKVGLKVDPLLGQAEGAQQKMTIMQAYTAALASLEGYGFRSRSMEEKGKEKDLQDSVISKYLPQVNKKLKAEGFKTYQIVTPKTSSTSQGHLIQLYGVRTNNTTYLLLSLQAETILDGRREIFRKYIEL